MKEHHKILELTDVSVTYDGLTVVQNIDFSVIRGERYVIMGQSGSGKSTILKAIGGFIKPSSGKILLNGTEVKAPGLDRMVVWQDLDQLLPWKTIEENVAFPLIINGIPRVKAISAAREWIERLGISRAARQYPHQLSGGMKQRAAIARGFVVEPEILLMDEPFSALDALTRYRLQEELISLHEKYGVTVVFITHDVDEAVRIGSKILVISQFPGTIKKIYKEGDPNLKKMILESIFEGKRKNLKNGRNLHE